ncbi:AVAST type 1 anti-phage system MBL fold metallo-hydrolase Avs1a [Flavobacterium sp. KACC 22763]|uniref:AVAST type 1 anti-phage system MBL fold metallo-hydrolase Avs1a n=1 Tax=Flavobacterium sp. KACC 22763 TaxID=3025668 RepID=UPI002366F357|nr:AVAST type 1 anti-phage system MBL fold metallo-hydrolase Avs1a [Flavobacterium sp. KACC 22763]WDF66121.1 MBL fold metallo-hydrolase [Flavobacterium sp. KACC 22763]
MEKTTEIFFFPALNGDSFLVSSEGTNVLIDGGYVNTYRNFLKPKLQELKLKQQVLDLIVVTHIDGDHISGINKLLEENNNVKFIDIKNIWHNSYRHLQFREGDDKKFFSDSLKSLAEMKTTVSLKEELLEKERDVSVKKGSALAKLIHEGLYNWNKHFSGSRVVFHKEALFEGSFSFLILSPNKFKLDKLKDYWLKELYKLGYVNDLSSSDFIDDAFEFVIASAKEMKVNREKNISASYNLDFEKLLLTEFSEDNAPANGSSISFIMQSGNSKILFLGDSHPSVIIESLKLLYADYEFPLYFDAIKVAHHGSAVNTNDELLHLIDSKKFLISTNGNSFGHPDMETIARIVTRKTDYQRTLYFNYPLEIISHINDEKMKEKYNYKCVVSEGAAIKITLHETIN